MNKKFAQLAVCFILGIGIQAGAYLYMDRVLFAPLSSGDYDMSDVKDKMAEAAEKEGKKLFAKVSVKGKAYYSHDYKYMADVTADTVTIYKADDLGNPQKVDLKNQGVSFFEWMPDRNLALMALYPAHWKGGRWDVTLARYNPDGTTTVTSPGSTAVTEIGTIQLAKFINPSGLKSIGKNLFTQTSASGDAVLGTPGLEGFGTISQGFVEISNVDIVEELIEMIVAQRAYETNSRSVRTADEMLNRAINLGR